MRDTSVSYSGLVYVLYSSYQAFSNVPQIAFFPVSLQLSAGLNVHVELDGYVLKDLSFYSRKVLSICFFSNMFACLFCIAVYLSSLLARICLSVEDGVWTNIFILLIYSYIFY